MRHITPADHDDVLALNERHVEMLAPLDATRLTELLAAADRAEVIEVDGRFAGFVVTVAAGSAYDGENFAWFTEHCQHFCYLDRIAVHEDHQRRGIASLVYDDLERGWPLFALEVNLEPPNEASLAFHRARGYTEVGRRRSGGHLVSLMTRVAGDAS